MDSTAVSIATHYKPSNTFEYLIVMSALCFIAYFWFNKKGKHDSTGKDRYNKEVESRFKRDYDAINELKRDVKEIWNAIEKQADNHLDVAKLTAEIKGMLK